MADILNAVTKRRNKLHEVTKMSVQWQTLAALTGNSSTALFLCEIPRASMV
jgi:hypothetical protein